MLTELGPTIVCTSPFTPQQHLLPEIQSRPVLLIEPHPVRPSEHPTEPGSSQSIISHLTAHNMSQRFRGILLYIVLQWTDNSHYTQNDYCLGSTSIDPCELVRSLLPEGSLQHRVTILSFGEGIQMGDVERALYYSMQKGLWLVLHGCHLAPRWSPPVLTILEVIA